MIAYYARQSVERDNSVSIETQLEYCQTMLRPYEKGLSVKQYVDEGCSGGTMDRPAFGALLQDIRNGKIKKVVVYKLDRISRSFVDFVGILQLFQAHGVEFVSSQESFDTSTVYGDLVLKILIVFAEFERTSIINRVRDAYQKRTDMGLYMGGRPLYGFALEETTVAGIATKQYTPILEAIEQVQYIYRQYALEHMTLRKLLTQMVKNGMKPYRGKDWTTAKLSALIKNPAYVQADSRIYDYYAGRKVRIVDALPAYDGTRAALLYGKTTHDSTLPDWSDMKLVLAQHKGVIPSALWLQCQKKLEQNRQIGKSCSNQTSWLAGKLVCAQCGHTMTTIKSAKRDGENRRYFVCTGKAQKKTCKGPGCTIYAEDLEHLAECYIEEMLSVFGVIRIAEEDPYHSERNAIQLKITELEQQQEKLANLLLCNDINPALISILNQKAEALSEQVRQLAEKCKKLRQPMSKQGIHCLKHWKMADFWIKKSVADVLLYALIIDEDGSCEFIWNLMPEKCILDHCEVENSPGTDENHRRKNKKVI